MRYGCLVYSLEDMLMLKCVTEREEDSRNRNNKHDFKGENVIFVTVVLFVF